MLLPMSSLDASRDSPDSSVSIASTLHKQWAWHSAWPCLNVVAHSPLPLALNVVAHSPLPLALNVVAHSPLPLALRLVLPSLGRQHQPQTVLHATQKLLSGSVVKVKGYLVGYKGILLQSPGGGVQHTAVAAAHPTHRAHAHTSGPLASLTKMSAMLCGWSRKM